MSLFHHFHSSLLDRLAGDRHLGLLPHVPQVVPHVVRRRHRRHPHRLHEHRRLDFGPPVIFKSPLKPEGQWIKQSLATQAAGV